MKKYAILLLSLLLPLLAACGETAEDTKPEPVPMEYRTEGRIRCRVQPPSLPGESAPEKAEMIRPLSVYGGERNDIS